MTGAQMKKLTDQDLSQQARDAYNLALDLFGELRARGCKIKLAGSQIDEPRDRTVEIIKETKL